MLPSMKYRDNRSRRIFAFICRYTREFGFPPTLGEIAADEGFKSNSGVIRHLDKLEKWVGLSDTMATRAASNHGFCGAAKARAG